MGEFPGLSKLLDLPHETLGTLAEALHSGPLRKSTSSGLLSQYVGGHADWVAAVLNNLRTEGCSPSVIAEMCKALQEAKRRELAATRDLFLVLSGPDVPGVPVVDTSTVARSLFVEARYEVLVCSYVIYSIPEFFDPLAEKMGKDSGFRVRFIVDISHERQHAAEPLPIVAGRFRKRFLSTCWKSDTPPELLHDPRPFLADEPYPGLQHAKIIVADRSAALVTSANFTQAAHSRNIEAGFLCRERHQVERIADYFEALITTRKVVSIE